MNKLLINIFAITIFIVAVFSGSKVLAQNTLNSVVISPAENGTYNIILDTNESAKVTKNISSKNTLIINLKNSNIANNAKTVYKAKDSIDHLIVKPSNKDLTIEVTGKNIEKSNILSAKDLKPINPQKNNYLLAITMLILLGICIKVTRFNKKKINVVISNIDEDNKILKVAFERKNGLIAKGTGTTKSEMQRQAFASNIRIIDFEKNYYDQKVKSLK